MNYQITKISEQQVLGPTGQPIPMILIAYKIGDHGPFTLTIPKDQFNDQVVRDKINAFASHILNLTKPA